MLNKASNENTLYSTICNLETMDIIIFNQHHFDDSVVFNLATELKKGSHVISIPSIFPGQEPGLNNIFTPWVRYTPLQNLIYVALGLLLAASVVASGILMVFVKPNRLQTAFLAVAGGSSTVLLWLVFFLNDKLYFAAKYSLNIYGTTVSRLSWIAAMLTIGQVILIILMLVIKKNTMAVRIYALAVTTIILIGWGYLAVRLIS